MAEKSGRRIVMLSSQMLPEVFGGAEQQCLRLSRALSDLGERPHVLTSRCSRDLPAEDEIDGVPVTRILVSAPPQRGGWSIGSSIRWMLAAEAWIKRRRHEIDLVHCHQAKLNAWAGVRAARSIGVPSLVKLGTAGPNLDFYSLERKKWFWGRIAARKIARDASMIVAISDEMLSDTSSYGIPEARRILIPNGIKPIEANASARAEIRRALGCGPGDRLLLFVGRMETQKNVSTLLEAFARLPKALANCKLVLLGDGALLNRHRSEASALGLEGRASFKGRVDNVPEYLAAADIFVLPPLAEGMSNALLEAMSTGTPQIASEVSGNTDLIEHDVTGWLYGMPKDIGGLTRALEHALALSDGDLAAIGETARQRVSETYDIDVIARRYVALYDDLC
ncbi:MAG: glycosyltransferase family 4 protein, partial [Paracoccaceae bacterium]